MKEAKNKRISRDERQYFRIDDSLPLDYNLMSEQEFLREKRPHRAAHVNHMEAPEVRGIDDPLLQYLQAIDRKLNFIISHLTEEVSEPDIPSVKEINISAGGLRFYSEKPYKVGSILKIRVGFPPFPHRMLPFIGKVVRVERSTDKPNDATEYSIAVQFIEIDEREKEETLRYIFETERGQIKGKSNTI
ncbi:MAG: PilZ domain-containing protein [Deltaproteobacteria bacterium]|nr:PilZ domain-containing protein [Deltaproteobacteria bacterium]